MKLLVKIVAEVEKGHDVEISWPTLQELYFRGAESQKMLKDWATQNHLNYRLKSNNGGQEKVVHFSRMQK